MHRQIGLTLCICSIVCLITGFFMSPPLSMYLFIAASLLGAASALFSWISTRPTE